ncbi:hypothetical protein Landi51_13016 [Colletotrichum acutatum]
MKGNMTNNDEMYETSMVQQLPSGPCLDTQISKNLEFLVVARSSSIIGHSSIVDNGDGTVSLVVCKREYKYMLANEVLQTVKKCESASANRRASLRVSGWPRPSTRTTPHVHGRGHQSPGVKDDPASHGGWSRGPTCTTPRSSRWKMHCKPDAQMVKVFEKAKVLVILGVQRRPDQA